MQLTCAEDPFLHARNLHCVLRQQNESQLRDAIRSAASSMRDGILPDGLNAAAARPSFAVQSASRPVILRKSASETTTAAGSPSGGSDSGSTDDAAHAGPEVETASRRNSGPPRPEALPTTLLGASWAL